jgi:hypothetical protein
MVLAAVVAILCLYMSIVKTEMDEDLRLIKFEVDQMRDTLDSYGNYMNEFEEKFDLMDSWVDGVRKERDNAIRRY